MNLQSQHFLKRILTQLLPLSDKKVVSYSYDKSIQIWSINGKDLKNEFSFQAQFNHTLTMNNLDKNRFALVDGAIIKIYSSEAPYTEIASLKGHKSAIYCLFKLRDKNVLLSWDEEGYLLFWDTELYKHIGEMKIIPCGDISSIYQCKNGKVLLGSEKTIHIINTKTFQIENIIDIKINSYDFYWGTNGKVCFLEFDNNTVLCFSENGWIRQFDCDTFTLIDIVKHQRVQGVFKLNELQFITYTKELIHVNKFY